METKQVNSLNYVGAINDALDVALGRDPSVILLGEDIADPPGGVVRFTKGLSTKYGPDRVRATPIAEQGIVGAAVGAALAGMRPVAEIMLMDFMTVAMDQLVNHAAKARYMSGGRSSVPLTVRTRVGKGNGAQHSSSVESWLMSTPGLKVCMPSNPAEAKGLLLACVEDNDPCVFIESTAVMTTSGRVDVPSGHYTIPLGEASVVREGADVSVIAYGPMVLAALKAADALAEEGISVEVVDLRTIVPLDTAAILRSVGKTRRAVVAHASSRFAGPGAEISSLIHSALFNTLLCPVKRLGAVFAPPPFARNLEAIYGPTSADIELSIRELMQS